MTFNRRPILRELVPNDLIMEISLHKETSEVMDEFAKFHAVGPEVRDPLLHASPNVSLVRIHVSSFALEDDWIEWGAPDQGRGRSE
jgi:hypothetical protein